MSVLESAPVSSTVGRVFAKDLDEGINAEMKYTIVDGDGADAFDINTDPNFQVGIITVKKVTELLLPSHFREGFERVCNISKDCYIINSIALNPLINTFLSLRKKNLLDFPGSPMVKTPTYKARACAGSVAQLCPTLCDPRRL